MFVKKNEIKRFSTCEQTLRVDFLLFFLPLWKLSPLSPNTQQSTYADSTYLCLEAESFTRIYLHSNEMYTALCFHCKEQDADFSRPDKAP